MAGTETEQSNVVKVGRFRTDGVDAWVLVEGLGWMRTGPIEEVGSEMCDFLATIDFGERQ